MRIFHFSNKFPPDDLADLFRRLRLHSKCPNHVILARVLEEVTDVVREEITELPAELRSLLPLFQSILDLAESFNWHQGPLSGTFECVFLVLMPVCLFVGRPDEFVFRRDTSLFTGLGLGFLAATAIVASPSLCSVPVTVAEVVRMAMRTGLLIYQRSQDLEPQSLDGALESWTSIVKGMGEVAVREGIDEYNSSTDTPQPSSIYISVVEPDGSVFINGPPSRLRKFFSTSGKVQSAAHAPLPVYGGPCHAPHLYDHSHSLWAVKKCRAKVLSRDLSHAAYLLSMADGNPLKADTVLELFESATYILLTSIIRWGDVVNAITASSPLLEKDMKLQVEILRPSPVVDGLVSAIQKSHPGCSAYVVDLGEWIFDDTHISPHGAHEKIAVIGMSCRLPGGADDLELLWELLREGRDVHRKVPADRYDVDSHTDITGKQRNTSHTPFGCFVDQPGLFDAGFFDMSPREAGQTDPTHRLALLTAYEALEQSGYVPDRTRSTRRERVGTIYGQCSDDYRECNAGQDIDMYFIPGNYRAFAPGRISYFFKFSGPSFNIDTACSASLAAVQIACSVLSRGEADMVVAGGLNILTGSDSFAGLSKGFFLSKTGNCQVFDDAADGYCRGDGIGSIILKRLSDAQQDNDNILGLILGSATNHSSNAISITHPHAPTQANLYRSTLMQAGVRPQDVDLVEMHGTGTQAGDAAEIESVTKVFSPAVPRRSQPLRISSVKANVGHGEAAAGITALIKALLIFKHNEIPPQVCLRTTLNSKFPDLRQLNVHIPKKIIPWPRLPGRKRYIMVNNFSAAGGNTSLLLEEMSSNEIRRYCVSKEHNLASLAYTTTARRMHHKYRIVVHGASIQEIVKSLEQHISIAETQCAIQKAPTIGFVFSGQGSFYQGVGRQLFQEYPPYRNEIQRLDEICTSHGFDSILPAITSRSSDILEISPFMAQLVTVCVQIALCRLWRSLGVIPNVVVGASLGEYAALYAAGTLSASDVIYLVGQRARLMQELCTINSHSMLAVKATIGEIRHTVRNNAYEFACINGPRDVTLAASVEDTNDIQQTLASQGYRVAKLNVPFAFHSSQIEPILEPYNKIAHSVIFRNLKTALISPLLSDVVFDNKSFPPSYLRDSTRGTVQFSDAMTKAQEIGLVDSKTVWVEIGVHQTYTGAMRANIPNLEVVAPSLRSDESNWHTLAASMSALHSAGVHLDWNTWYKPFESQLRLLNLPPYQWNLKNHWIQHNGDWLLLKDKRSRTGYERSPAPAPPPLRTALVHHILEESFGKDGGTVVIQSNVTDDEFHAVASGHKMSGRPLVSVFAYTDIALIMARYMYSRLKSGTELSAMDFGKVRVFQGLIPRKDRSKPQYVRMRMQADPMCSSMPLSLHRVLDDEMNEEELAIGVVTCGDSHSWRDEWAAYSYLLTSRIEALHQLADQGLASRVSKDLVYTLFKNVVDYAEHYRGIQSAVMYGLEAVADVILSPSQDSRWTAPPHHIDPITHVGGLILNAGPAMDYTNTIYVMEGWESMRFSDSLMAGELYRSYVKMNPANDNSGFFSGDVYILHGNRVIGRVREMTLRPLPRILMSRFFDPPDSQYGQMAQQEPSTALPSTPQHTSSAKTTESTQSQQDESDNTSLATPENENKAPISGSWPNANSQLVRDAIALIASETGVEPDALTDETEFSAVGVDSLLSLVLVEKFALELNIDLQGSFFLETPNVCDLKAYLEGNQMTLR
ncbi:polyketide [Aspergillus oryzae 100-8]|uniref:Polyketide synthase module n=1 Tax=Aspergillus oryzae (strain 3.042) TaxID=1160506 RepID=I8TLL9_ASPO3|nr:polyketide synthase module [Aspergillus oryzae 3.042]KDE81226.1 polyketide [Aspergillus oryzae 100-8]|eukprot:EIT75060.1 polyketide synthase module [Aspergillus oryzae 3.042]